MARFNIWGTQMTLQGRTFEELWLKFRQGQEATAPGHPDYLCGLPSPLFILPRVKTARHQAQPSAEVRNEWSYTSTSAGALMGCTGEILFSRHSTVRPSLRTECFALLAFTQSEYHTSALLLSQTALVSL